MKAIVIGAGIGGLSAAVALKQSGIDCDVYEAVKEIPFYESKVSVCCIKNLSFQTPGSAAERGDASRA